MPEAILVVDEISANRKLTHRVLSKAGFAVRSVADAAAALDAIPEFQPQLVLTELQLAGMDGLALTRRIKEDPRTRRTKVIAITGCGAESDREAALGAGCDDFLLKPIDTRALPAIVQTHLDKRDREAGDDYCTPDQAFADLGSWAPELCREFARDGAAKVTELLRQGASLGETKQAAHVWAGLGGTFGFPEITRLARELERRCDLSGGAPITGKLQQLAALFAQALRYCEQNVPGPRLPEALVQGIYGRSFALVGFDSYDRERLQSAIEQAGGSAVLPGNDTPDLTIASAASEVTQSRPLLLLGVPAVNPQLETLLDSEALDFAAAPWAVEEVLARACRLLARRAPGAPPARPVRDRKLRVVIADDDTTVVALLKTTLESYGIECAVASEGDQALELMRAAPPDAAILDVIMPNMDGLEVLAAVRNDPALRDVRLLLLSALQQESDIVRAFGLGADDYVTKPFSPLEVVARLKRLVRSES